LSNVSSAFSSRVHRRFERGQAFLQRRSLGFDIAQSRGGHFSRANLRDSAIRRTGQAFGRSAIGASLPLYTPAVFIGESIVPNAAEFAKS
jgi:hypothetical protein